MVILTLNPTQYKAYKTLSKFLLSEDESEFLLLGPAGSGKTTVIVNAFNTSSMTVAFCAFTNKATQVLKNISDKFDIHFIADFMTIHNLLRLEIRYSEIERDVSFSFDPSKIEHLKNYNVLIFDECSTISAELYKYIRLAQAYILKNFNIKLKLIFLGDYWQVPPVNEDKSIIFTECKLYKWPISKLGKVMRCTTEQMAEINDTMLNWISLFKDKHNASMHLNDFVKHYPFSALEKDSETYLSMHNIYEKFLDTWQNVTPDTIILTYSRANCDKINHTVQDYIDSKNHRTIVESRTDITFYPGDRCCLDRPVTLFKILKLDSSDSDLQIVKCGESLNSAIYNGEIFDVIECTDVLVQTCLNRFKYLDKTLPMQLLTISRTTDRFETFQILHCKKSVIDAACTLIKKNERRMVYINLLQTYVQHFPTLNYGYCTTIYKAQGSEWNTVFIFMNSIKFSIIGKQANNSTTDKQKYQLFKATYTALTRASKRVMCNWGWN